MIRGSVIEKHSCFVFLVSGAFRIKQIDFYDIILIQTLKKAQRLSVSIGQDYPFFFANKIIVFSSSQSAQFQSYLQ